jgi:HK97 gp10 family phage protein
MPGVRIKWHDKKTIAGIEKEMRRRLNRIGVMVASEIRRRVSKSARSHGHSVPHAYPHANTGRFRKSVVHSQSGNSVVVGTNTEYAKFLEEGTVKMQPRPSLRRTVIDMQARIRAELGKKM